MKTRYQTWDEVPHGGMVKTKHLFLVKPYEVGAVPVITARRNGLGSGWVLASGFPPVGPFKEVVK